MTITIFKSNSQIAARQIDRLERLSRQQDSRKIPQNAALVVIDMQIGFDDKRWGNRNNTGLSRNIETLLKTWRGSNRSIIHIQHCSVESNSVLRSELESWDFYPSAQPIDGEVVFQKNVNSCFTGTNLETYCAENNIDTLVIMGISTDHCVSTSTRLAANLGFTIYLISDATCTFDRVDPITNEVYPAELVHKIHLASLSNEFAKVLDTKSVLELLE